MHGSVLSHPPHQTRLSDVRFRRLPRGIPQYAGIRELRLQLDVEGDCEHCPELLWLHHTCRSDKQDRFPHRASSCSAGHSWDTVSASFSGTATACLSPSCRASARLEPRQRCVSWGQNPFCAGSLDTESHGPGGPAGGGLAHVVCSPVPLFRRVLGQLYCLL